MKKYIYLLVLVAAGFIYPGIASCQNVVNVRGINRTVYTGDTLDLYFDISNQLTKIHTNNIAIVFDKPLRLNTDTFALLSDVRNLLGSFDLTTKINKSDTNVYVVTYKYFADHAQEALGFTPENIANKSTDGTMADNSDTKYPSQKAVRTFVLANSSSSDSITTLTFTDNTTNGYVELTTGDSIDLNINYLLKRGSASRVGDLKAYYYSGTLIYDLGGYMENSSTGVTFNSITYDAGSHKLRLYYTSTSTGSGGTIKYKNTKGIISNLTSSGSSHDAVTLGTANGLSLTGQELSLGTASTSTTGALTSTDWNTFNGKLNASDTIPLHNQIITKEPNIASSTLDKYWRGDKTWQTFPTYSAGNCMTLYNNAFSLGGTQTADVEITSSNSRTFTIGGTTAATKPAAITLWTYLNGNTVSLQLSDQLNFGAANHGDIKFSRIGRYLSDYKTLMTNDNDLISLGKVKQMLTDSGYLKSTQSISLTNGIHKASGNTFTYYTSKTDAGGASSSGKWWTGTDVPTSTTSYTFDGALVVPTVSAATFIGNSVSATAGSFTSQNGIAISGYGTSGMTGYFLSDYGVALKLQSSGNLSPTVNPILVIQKNGVGTNILQNDIISITDNPLTSGSVTGKVLKYVAGSTERITLDPRVTNSGSAVAFRFDTHTSLTSTGAKLLYVGNAGTEKFSVDKDGNVNLAAGANFRINGTALPTSAPNNNITFSGTVDLSNPFYTSYANYTVTSALAVTASSTKVNGSSSVIVFIGDGNSSHIPSFSGFYKVGNNSYDYTNGARNVITFVCIGTSVYYTINVAVLQ